MDTKQVLDVINSGETQEVEFKESFHSSQDISKLMCGFANTYGGVILIGVSADRRIVGVGRDTDGIQQKMSSSAQSVSPPILPSIKVHEIDGRKVVAAVVQRAADGTFHTFQGVIWARVGSTLKKMEGAQIVDFLRGKQILCFDETPGDAGIEDLDAGKIRDYLSMRGQQDYFKSHSITDFLLSARLAVNNGGLKVKNSALLFFAKNPLQFNPQAEMKLVRFDGTEPVKIVAHELVQSAPVESIEKSLSFVRNNLPRSIRIKDSARREERLPYPVDVIREVIVNAVTHRDYFNRDAIQAYIFSDRIEVTNPGSLPQNLPKELFGTLSVQRNPITYRILRDYGYVEGVGSGIPRMIDSMREHGLADPEFGIYEQFFRVTLRSKTGDLRQATWEPGLSDRQLKALDYLTEKKSLKTKDYMRINEVSYGTARADINEMIKAGVLKKMGSYRGAYYMLDSSGNR